VFAIVEARIVQGIGKTTKLMNLLATVILAMGAGRKAAQSIDEFLASGVWA
jgi:hypothetical protein